MRLGIYSDLHANLPALEALFSSAGSWADKWFCAGDSVGIFPFVNEVLDFQRANDIVAVRGDHESLLLSGEEMAYSFSGNQALVRQRETLSAPNRRYLESLPAAMTLQEGGRRITLTHTLGSSSGDTGGGKRMLDVEALEAQYAGSDYVFWGHTHYLTILHAGSCRFINPGSLGFPIDVEKLPSAILLDTDTGDCRMLRLRVDNARLVQSVINNGYNKKLIHYLDNAYNWNQQCTSLERGFWER